MTSGEITAIITGVGAVLAAGVTGYFRVRAARVEKSTNETPGPQPPITVTPPREASGAVKRDGQSAGVPGPATASPAAPMERVLPLVHPDRTYKGLSQPGLDAQFLTDVQFTLKEGDRFIFEDDPGEPQ